MKTLVTAIQKGGQGKTFATCHLALDFHERLKRRVLVLDLDTQGNATFTLEAHVIPHAASKLLTEHCTWGPDDFGPAGKPTICVMPASAELADMETRPLSEVVEMLRANLAALAEHFDVCFIDTPPSLGVMMTAAVLCADYMLSPVELEAYSLHGLEKMLTVLTHLREDNPGLKFLGMLPNKVNGRDPRHQAELDALRTAYPGLVMPVQIGLRASIAEALGAQQPVWSNPKTAARPAKKEVRALTDYVSKQMEISR